VAGEGASGIPPAHAALWEPEIAGHGFGQAAAGEAQKLVIQADGSTNREVPPKAACIPGRSQ